MRSGAHAVPAFFHFHNHHFDGDDGVIDQQTQRDDERAQGDAVEVHPAGQHEQQR